MLYSSEDEGTSRKGKLDRSVKRNTVQRSSRPALIEEIFVHTVLIVDDSEMFRRIMKRIIGANLTDCLIREAADGPEAIR